MRALEPAYLEFDDPVRQSGFAGGRDRWIAERSPLVDGIHRDGDFLDVGCANGLLLVDVVAWAGERGHTVTPHGMDLGPELIALARERLPGFADQMWVADAWALEPDRQWTFVYSLLDLSPPELTDVWLQRLHSWVAPGGRLIIGSYGSKSRDLAPLDVGRVLRSSGFDVAGESSGGEGPITRFAWAEKR